MAINMAIGFINLGHGRFFILSHFFVIKKNIFVSYSFNNSDLSVAALLISIYPHFPNSPNDNKYHLQPLRHFYVLAIE